MMDGIKLKNTRPDAVSRLDILLNGRNIGHMDVNENGQFHSCITLTYRGYHTRYRGDDSFMIQGFGSTPEAAIKDAMRQWLYDRVAQRRKMRLFAILIGYTKGGGK